MAISKKHTLVVEFLRARGATESAQTTKSSKRGSSSSSKFILLPYDVPDPASHETLKAPLFPESSVAATTAQSQTIPTAFDGGDDSWRTVRLFISSTFLDMNAERDLLVKKVIPVLRDRCAARKLHVVDVDMRWGITADEAKSGSVTRLCLEEIDQTSVFCCLLGMRYGWVPAPNEVPDDVRAKFVWQDGLSITAAEVARALSRRRSYGNPQCCFFLRRPEFIKSVPGQEKDNFAEQDPLIAAKLEKLKAEVRAEQPMVSVVEYDAIYDN
jgi:telomerase protein component 1